MTLPEAAGWTDLGGGVRVRQSRAFMMNSCLLLDPEHSIVIDPGVLETELDDLARMERAAAPAATSLFLTHAHWDHVLGGPWWPGAETIAHDRFAGELKADEARVLSEVRRIATEQGEAWSRGFTALKPRVAISGLHYTTRGPWHMVFRDAPGHCDSQLSLHLPDRSILIAADMLSDVEIPILNRPPAVYRKTLEPLLQLAENGAVETLIPGHGSIAHGRDAALARIREDLAYLAELERRALASRRGGQDAAQAADALDDMEYRGKRGGPFPMRDIHRDNVAIAWHAAGKPGRR